MPRTTEAPRARPGDIVTIEGHKVGDAGRSGVVVEVLGEPGHEHYLVRWEDDRETLFYPSNDATFRHVARKEGR